VGTGDGLNFSEIKNYFFRSLIQSTNRRVTTLTELCRFLSILCLCRQLTGEVCGNKCEILGSVSSTDKDSFLLGFYVTSFGE
jgi:hypothetical protein